MVLWNALEDLRRRENRRRGYVEVKTPLLYDIQTLRSPRGTTRTTEENMFFVHTHEGEEPLALKPMNCPGHMLLFGSKLRSYRDLPIRYAESSTLHRDERGGTLHGLLRVKHITQDDAHVFVTRGPDPGRDRRDDRLHELPLRPVRSRPRARSSRPARRSGSARTSSGIGPSARSSPRCNGTGSRTRSRRARARSTARRSTST